MRSSPAFSLIGTMTGVVVLAGVAALCLPALARRLRGRTAAEVQGAAAHVEASLGRALAGLPATIDAYAHFLASPPWMEPVPAPPPPLPASPVEIFPAPAPLFAPWPEGLFRPGWERRRFPVSRPWGPAEPRRLRPLAPPCR